MRTRVQLVIGLGALGLAAWVAVSSVRHWGDWVVLGVIVMTTIGLALAVWNPRYPVKKRTFTRTTKPPR